MSCPNWRELAAYRATRSGEEPEGYGEALAHLETCTACWDEALAADPTLLFRRLPDPSEATLEDFWDAEVASVQQAVAAMRTASRLESLETSPRRGVLGRSWKEWAAAAALVATVGGVGSWYGLTHRPVDMGAEIPSFSLPAKAVPAASNPIEVIEGSAYSEIRQLGGQSRDDIAVTVVYGSPIAATEDLEI